MPAWLILQHAPHEGPGLIATKAAERGLELASCRAYLGKVPSSAAGLAGLIVMGGPMGVADVAAYPFLQAEMELIADARARELPILGVCLGAQLLAAALGADVRQGPEPEIGFGSVALTEAGRDDPFLGGGAQQLPVFHWHNDTFEVPVGSVRLAASDAYPNQAFRHGELAYALQFHIEVDQALASQWEAHLPAGVAINPGQRRQLEAHGGDALERFFELAIG